MPELSARRGLPSLACLIACVALSACGSSSGGTSGASVSGSASSGTTTTTASTPTASSPTVARSVHHHLSPGAYAALLRYVACMRTHGIKLPHPHRVGSGPILDIAGLNPSSVRYRTASAICQHFVLGLL